MPNPHPPLMIIFLKVGIGILIVIKISFLMYMCIKNLSQKLTKSLLAGAVPSNSYSILLA